MFISGEDMLKKVLNKALNYYDNFDYLTIVNKEGIIEYATVYSKEKNTFINQQTTGLHILDMYPSLTQESSSILKALKTGKEIYNTIQELKYLNNRTYFLLNSDFPIVNDGTTIGVIEVSVSLNSEAYANYLSGSSIIKQKRLFTLDDIITEDQDFLELKTKIGRISKTNSSVLIIGETGTGKDMIAQSIHSHSYRLGQPFIAQNCAAIPSTLLESTFFGTVKGAYTGAENTIGLFELAKGGTLFLDEINSMDIRLQAKILKAIEEKTIRRVGGTKNIETDVRIISAMNIRPEEAIAKEILREDLFYRLSVVQLKLPPLRERKADIRLLSNYFIQKYNMEMGRNIEGITELVMNIFNEYSWKGNVRELQNVIESAFNVAAKNIIDIQDVPDYLYKDFSNENIKIDVNNDNMSLEERIYLYEKEIIFKEVTQCHTLAEAAKRLKISPQSLQYKLKKYFIKK